MTVGEHTYGHEGIQVRGEMNNITIGKYCSIARGVVIDGGFNHNAKFVSTFPFLNRMGIGAQNVVCKGDVIIGNDVWICENVLIMSGVTIGNGAIIGANTIVTKDIPHYMIVAGSPAKMIGTRFKAHEKHFMEKIAWWNWPDQNVLDNVDLLTSDNIEEFIKKHHA